jgi:hypothetical protein
MPTGRGVLCLKYLCNSVSPRDAIRPPRVVIYFRVQTSSSHPFSHLQSQVGAPIIGSSTPHRRHPLVMT